MNRRARMKRGKFYRHGHGALVVAVSATKARTVSNGYLINHIRDYEVTHGPWEAEKAAKIFNYDQAALEEWAAGDKIRDVRLSRIPGISETEKPETVDLTRAALLKKRITLVQGEEEE